MQRQQPLPGFTGAAGKRLKFIPFSETVESAHYFGALDRLHTEGAEIFSISVNNSQYTIKGKKPDNVF